MVYIGGVLKKKAGKRWFCKWLALGGAIVDATQAIAIR
jgi:hypothetical protein